MFYIKEIHKIKAITFIKKYHYSKIMPRLTKHYLGYFNDNELLGVLTLGWGTQPLQTIRKILPNKNFETKDYFEIGKMCLHPKLNQNGNAGSHLISLVKKWMIKNTECSFLYTLADGIVGKVGYVYQASNFYYLGYFWTDVYIGSDGEKIHPRSTKQLCKENAEFSNKEKIFWLTIDFMKYKGIRKIKGKMFRYMLPLNKKSRKVLKELKFNNVNYPKHNDLQWKEQIDTRKYIFLDKMPNFDLDAINVNQKNVKNSGGCEIIDLFE